MGATGVRPQATRASGARINPFTSLFKRKESSEAKRLALKDNLRARIKGTGRGVTASQNDRAEIDAMCAQLERMNPTKEVLGPYLSADWLLEYTTSDSILGTRRPFFLRANGPIYQTIRAEKLEARNQETWPWFSAVVRIKTRSSYARRMLVVRSLTVAPALAPTSDQEATLVPMSKNKVAVQFQTFYIGSLIPIKAPPTARGELEITYLDEDLRISRGDKGNLFVLSR